MTALKNLNSGRTDFENFRIKHKVLGTFFHFLICYGFYSILVNTAGLFGILQDPNLAGFSNQCVFALCLTVAFYPYGKRLPNEQKN